MLRVYRTAGLVRGDHPYGFVVDDVKKDEAAHLYQWAAMLNGGVWQADVPNLAPGQIALAFRAPDPKADPAAVKPNLAPRNGEPLLLVCALGLEDSGDTKLPLFQVETLEGPKDRDGKAQYYDRLVINRRAPEANFRVLLIPTTAGQPAPRVASSAGDVLVAWSEQEDRIVFTTLPGGRTRTSVVRNGKPVLESQ